MPLYDTPIDWKAPSREWDIRVNLGDKDIHAEAEHFVSLCKKYITKVNVAYILVGGIEVGDKPDHSSFKKAHLHVALKTLDRVYPKAVKDKLELNCMSDGTSRNYYLAMRPNSLTYVGWRDHHIKLVTKIDTSKLILFEHGSLPKDKRKLEEPPSGIITERPNIDTIDYWREKGYTLSVSQDADLGSTVYSFVKPRQTKAEYKKAKANDRFQEMLEIYLSGDFDDREMLSKYGMAWATAKVQFKRTMGPVNCPDPPEGHFPDGKNILIYGPPGTGKSLYVKWKYPRVYQRDPLEMKWFNGFKPGYHTHIYYEDMDVHLFNRRDLSPAQWKVWMDPYSTYQGAMKYESPIDNIHHPVIVTSNYTIDQWFNDGHKYSTTDIQAISRRFNVIHIKDLLRKEGIRLKPNLPPHQKPENCFEPWDYENSNVVPTFNPELPHQ